MSRLARAAFASTLIAVSAPGLASAQITLGASVGPSFPVGDLGAAKIGWMGGGGVNVPIGETGFSVGASGFFGRNNHEQTGNRTRLYGVVGSAAFAFRSTGVATPYVFGSFGWLTNAFRSDIAPDSTNSGPAFGAGAGMTFPLGRLQGSLDVSYLIGWGDVDGTELLGASFGVGFPLG